MFTHTWEPCPCFLFSFLLVVSLITSVVLLGGKHIPELEKTTSDSPWGDSMWGPGKDPLLTTVLKVKLRAAHVTG